MNNTLNIGKLSRLVKAKRGHNGLCAASEEITRKFGEVSPSTLSRVENERVPDMETLLKLCNWLGVPAGELLDVEDAPEAGVDVATQIEMDNRLDATTAHALAEVVRAVYRGAKS